MSDKKNFIEPVKVTMPKRIGDAPKPKAPEPLPEKVEAVEPKPAQDEQPKIKKGMFEKLFNGLMGKLIPVLLQWIFPYPVYQRKDGEIVKDRKGKPVVDWPLTVVARGLSLVTVLYGTVEVLGLPLEEWIQRISGALGL